MKSLQIYEIIIYYPWK